MAPEKQSGRGGKNPATADSNKPSIVVYVAPDGDDTNPGTKGQPFATLTRARDAARQAKGAVSPKIVVRGGRYYDVQLVLEPQDSGLTIEAAPGEKPILYGGHLVANWKKDGPKFFAAALEGVRDRSWDFRMLAVNDRWRPRARLPRAGTFEHLSEFKVAWAGTYGGQFSSNPPSRKQLTTLKYAKGDPASRLDVRNAEISIYHSWDDSLVGLKRRNTKAQTLTFLNEAGYPPGAFGVRDYVVWNVKEGMHQPGQWYLDRTRGKLVYWPKANEDMAKVRVVAPTVERIISIDGAKRRPARNITIRGLTLSATTTPLVAGSFAANRFDGALSASYAHDCLLEGLAVRNVGGHGVKMRRCLRSRIENCTVIKTGAGGIYNQGSDDAAIADNEVGHIGLIYFAAVGISTSGRNIAVVHNEVHHTSYTGIIACGYRARMESNLIYRVMQVMSDGAGIYAIGRREMVMRGNLVHDVPTKAAHAYYFDELAARCVVEDNVAVNVPWPQHDHLTRKCSIRNNIFVCKGPCKLSFPRSTGLSFTKNVIYAQGGVSVLHPEALAEWKDNVVFSVRGQYDQVPEETVKADPRLVGLAKGKCNFRSGSPAAKLGIRPVDVSKAGRRNKRR